MTICFLPKSILRRPEIDEATLNLQSYCSSSIQYAVVLLKVINNFCQILPKTIFIFLILYLRAIFLSHFITNSFNHNDVVYSR